MRIVAYDPVVLSIQWTVMDFGTELKTLDEVLALLNFVSLHVPLTKNVSPDQ